MDRDLNLTVAACEIRRDLMRVPVDGIVREGCSEADRSFRTGESMPIVVRLGDTVVAGDVTLNAPLTIEVTAVGEDTALRWMVALAEIAESGRNRQTALAVHAAQIYAPAVHVLAFVTFLGWIAVSGDVTLSLNIAISVLIITCPCALGLVVPAVMTAASGRLFRRGLLVKDGTALERLAEVDQIAVLAAASQHPVARAISAAIPPDVVPVVLDDLREIAGDGVEGTWNGETVRLGRAGWVGAETSPALRMGEAMAVPLVFSETLRDGAAGAVLVLQSAGYDLGVLTGDTPQAAARLAALLHITDVRSDMRPEAKLAVIETLRSAERRVLMVGDGLNDTAALAAAHASMSPASALDASRAASDIVILGQSLAELPDAVATAKSARARVIENFAIAAGYNAIAIPIAVLGFATPLAAAIAMSASSITVLLNALRVR